MKRKIKAGSASVTIVVFIPDTSSTTGSGLTGLTNASSGLTCYYRREGASSMTAVSLAAGTLGTWSSGGFIQVDATHAPGQYELGIPDAALAAGAKYVTLQLRGATNMPEVPVEVELDAVDYQDATRFGLTALPNANAEAAGGLYTRGSGAGQINQPASGQIDANTVKISGTPQTARDIGASVLLSAGSGAGQLDFTSGVVKANLAQILGTALTETAGQIAAAFKKLFDVAAPVLTATSVNQTGDAYARLGAPAGASVSVDVAAVKGDTAAVKAKTDSLTFTGAGKVDASLRDWLGTAPNALVSGKVDAVPVIRNGTAQAGAAGSITLDAGASATDSLYRGLKVCVASGTGAGQSRLISGYTGATKVATVVPNWTTPPDATSVFIVLEWSAVDVEQWALSAPNALISGRVDANAQVVGDKTGYTASTVSDKTGYALTSAYDPAKTASQAGDAMALTSGERTSLAAVIWNALTSGFATVGSIGKLIKDNLDIAVSSRGDATAANQTTILNRLGAFTGSGLNTILGFLRALLRKDAALTPSDVGGTFDNTSMSLEAVRGDYTTARAVKIDHLDADVSSPGADTGGTTTLLGRIPGTVQPQTGDAYARLGAPVLATLSLDIAEIAAETDLVAAVKAKTDNLPASPAAVGSAMALTTSERSSVADALLDRADAVEVGLTPRQAMRLIAAAVAGKLAGAGTTTITIRNAVQDSKARITATVDAQGDRSAITWDVS